MMRRNLLIGIPVFFLLAGIGSAQQGPPLVLPPSAARVAPDVYHLGTARDVDGKLVEGYAFVHPKRGDSHRPGHGGGKPGGGGSSNCFAFFADGAKWKIPEPYVLDTTNSDGVSGTNIADWTQTTLGAWETAGGVQIFGNRDTTKIVDGADTVQPDGKNEIFFGDIPDEGVIGVTIVWGVFSGPTIFRQLVEFDSIFDDPDFTWGDAGPTRENQLGDTGIMDYQNIATHEFGHAAGMGHPAGSCTEETMYGFAQSGETKKRTLAAGDIAGIQKQY
jgi:hypothetical protein